MRPIVSMLFLLSDIQNMFKNVCVCVFVLKHAKAARKKPAVFKVEIKSFSFYYTKVT